MDGTFNRDEAIANLKSLGFADDDPEMKAIVSFAQMMQPQQPKVSVGQAIAGGIADGAVAGLARLGGANHAQAVSQANVSDYITGLSKTQAEQQMQLKQLIGKFGLERAFKHIDEVKRRKQLGDILGPKYTGAPSATSPAPIAPVNTPNPAPNIAGTPAPSGGPQIGELPQVPGISVSPAAEPPAGAPSEAAGGLPDVPGISVSPATPGAPAPSQGLPAAGPPPGAPAAPGGPVAPQGSAPAGGSAVPHGALQKYQIDPASLEPLPYTEQQIAAASMVDDKMADNMRQINDQVLKKNEQKIRLSEVQRAAAQNDPQLAAEIEMAKKNAIAQSKLDVQKKTVSREAKSVTNLLDSLYQLPDKVKDFDGYIGAIEGADGPWGAFNYARSGDSIATRTKIQGDIQGITVAMKKFVRQPGEGTWTDADQAGLERMVGNLMIAPDTKTYRAILGQVRDRISKAFTEPLGTKLGPLQGEEEDNIIDGTGGAAAASPRGGSTSAGNAHVATPGTMNGDQHVAIKEKFASSDPETRARIIDSLKKRGFDPAAVLSDGAPRSEEELRKTMNWNFTGG